MILRGKQVIPRGEILTMVVIILSPAGKIIFLARTSIFPSRKSVITGRIIIFLP